MNFNIESAISLLTEKLTHWWELGIKTLPNLVVALIVLSFFWYLARLIRKWTPKLLKGFSTNPTLMSLFSAISYVLVVIVGLFISLEILNLDKTVTSILAGAGVIGIALGFAFTTTKLSPQSMLGQ